MTTTTTYKGFGGEDKPSSRILKPPGGGSSDIFGGRQPMPTSPKSAANRAATSSIFAPAELDVLPKRSNPPGGKSSGIFDDSTTNKAVQQHSHPPGGKGSYAFGIGSLEPTRNQNPNKPVDSNIFGNDSSQSPEHVQVEGNSVDEEDEEETGVAVDVVEEVQDLVEKEDTNLSSPTSPSASRAYHPPGGKSSIMFG